MWNTFAASSPLSSGTSERRCFGRSGIDSGSNPCTTRVERSVYVASEVKALLAAGVAAAWDEETAYQQMHACFDPTRTLFRNIRQVPPGHDLVASEGAIRIERYWDVGYPRGASETHWDAVRCAEKVHGLLWESVRLRMRSDVPVGCLLSGGMDSSALLGMAARFAPSPKAFTISFDHPDYDEEPVARRTAGHFGADYEIVPVTQADCADHFADAVWHAEAIQANAHGVARYMLSRRFVEPVSRPYLPAKGRTNSSQATNSAGPRFNGVRAAVSRTCCVWVAR